jgi:hypothetical protein
VSVRIIKRRALGVAVAATLTAVAFSTPASAAGVLEKLFYLIGPRYDSQLPSCTDNWALNDIRSRFHSKESRFWNSDLSITDFDDIHEDAFRPWADGTIPRRFCSGKAQTSDGQWRRVRYSIIEDAGMIGGRFGVQWCVVGADRNWAYNPDCRAAGP